MAECVVCDKQVGWIDSHPIANKERLCVDCFLKGGFKFTMPTKTMTAPQIRAVIQEREQSAVALKSFVITKKIDSFLEVDENEKKWLIPDGFFGGKKNPGVYNYSDIIDFELLEDGHSISKGGLGRALVGGVLMGGVGAIVGGVTGGKKNKSVCDSLKIKITLNSIATPTIYINFITTPTRNNSWVYKTNYSFAQECLSILQLMCNSVEQQQKLNDSIPRVSGADEILKYKQLLDAGIITQKEFEEKKKQILGV